MLEPLEVCMSFALFVLGEPALEEPNLLRVVIGLLKDVVKLLRVPLPRYIIYVQLSWDLTLTALVSP
jgi:hypothetical protein